MLRMVYDVLHSTGSWEGRAGRSSERAKASGMRDRQFKNEQGAVAAQAGLLELMRTVTGQIAIFLDPCVTRPGR